MGRMSSTVWRVVIGAAVAASTGCGDDSGGSGPGGGGGSSGTEATSQGGSSGAGHPGEFTLNDVHFDFYDLAEGIDGPGVSFNIGWLGCPRATDCYEELTFHVNGVKLGNANGFPLLPRETLDELRAALQPGADVDISIEAPQFQASWIPIPCPGDFEIVAPAGGAVFAPPGPMRVEWTPLSRVASDEGGALAEAHSFVSEAQFDDDFKVLGGADVSVPIAPTDVAATLDIPQVYEDTDRLIVSVAAAGAIVRSPQNGEGSCNYIKQRAVALQ